ncbi:hypothetical protein SLEP1_g58164 [Rubroshorea leprosula]|uniref:Uncharacterized protein n=1 Tax=Rubroshorea leprosula TaxID=152421 RepID=A0AAV5MR93_9ROSI|nr:hypothetical protein SLEP1_g58164 [Rubroshorea leprosula]
MAVELNKQHEEVKQERRGVKQERRGFSKRLATICPSCS